MIKFEVIHTLFLGLWAVTWTGTKLVQRINDRTMILVQIVAGENIVDECQWKNSQILEFIYLS